MILQGSLRIEYNNESFVLMVKTFLMNGVYYFFISDKEKERRLLAGETLELTFTDSFCTTAEEEKVDNQKIPAEIVSAVKDMLIGNKQLWFY